MRHKFSGVFRAGSGKIVSNGTVYVFLAGTSTAASVYASATSTSIVNSTTTGTDGTFTFYVDRFDYDRSQQFKVSLSKTGFTDQEYDYLDVKDLITGTYTISADKTVTTDLGYIPKGVIYSVDSGKTLTISGTFEAGPYQIFSGTGTVTLSGVKEVYPEWFGAKDDSGTTDNTNYINYALASGGKIKLTAPNRGYYKITDNLDVTIAGTKIIGIGSPEIKQATANKEGFVVTASNVEISGIKITGAQYASSTDNERAIYAYGADSSHYITNLTIKDVILNTWGMYGIRFDFVDGFTFDNVTAYNIDYAGILGRSVKNGRITKPYIYNITNASEAYGVSLTRTANVTSLVTNPRSKDVTIFDYVISGVQAWTGIDTHGGERISIGKGIIYDTTYGINVGTATDDSAASTIPPIDCSIDGAILDSGVTNGSRKMGVIFHGATGGTKATGSVKNVVLRGYGEDGNAASSGFYFYATQGLVVTGNTAIECSPNAVAFEGENEGFTFTGNSIVDTWSASATYPLGVYLYADSNRGYIGGNSFSVGSKTATYKNGYCISVNQSTGSNNNSRIGQNYRKGWTQYISDDANYTLSVGTTTPATSGTGEDTLASVSIPAGTLGIKGVLKVTASGVKTGSGGNKTLKFYLGSTSVTFHAAANNTNDWRFEATIVNTGASTQKISWVGYDGATVLQGYDSASEDSTAAITMKFTGECADGGDSITQHINNIEWN